MAVSWESAAVLHGSGSLRAGQSEFTTLRRKQTQRVDIRYQTRPLTPPDVTLHDGLPVTTVERAIADLVEIRMQKDRIGGALRDAIRKTDLDRIGFVRFFEPLAEHNGP